MRAAAVLVLAACGGGDASPRAQVVARVRALCGDAYEVKIERRAEPMKVHSCPEVDAALALHSATWSISVRLEGPSDQVDQLQERALDVYAPLLDRQHEALLRELVTATVRTDGAGRNGFWEGSNLMDGQTEIDLARPWLRTVDVMAQGLAAIEEPIHQPMPPLPPDAETISPLGAIDLAAWMSACTQDVPLAVILGGYVGSPAPVTEPKDEPHDRWNVGDRWLRCRAEGSMPAARLELDATWAPTSMALLYVQLSTRGASPEAFDALVTRFLDPVLASTQRDCAHRVARTETGESCDGVFVRWSHAGDDRELTLIDDPAR